MHLLVRAGACSAGNLAGNGYTQRYGSFLSFFFFALVSIVFHRTHPPHSPTHYLTGMARPPPKIRLTLEGVCLMLGHNSVEWEDIRKVSMQSSEISHSNTTINTTPAVSCTVIPRSFYDKANSLRLSLASSPKISSNKKQFRCLDLLRYSVLATRLLRAQTFLHASIHNCRSRLRDRLKKTYLANPLLTLEVHSRSHKMN